MPGDDRPKRPPTSSDDRALAGRERRKATPAHGVEFDDERTPPPSDFEELVRRIWPLRKLGDDLMETATRVTRLEVRADNLDGLAGGVAAIGDHVAEDAEVHREITEKLADIHGRSGTNGKLGELRRRVDALSSKAWWLFTAFVGALGAALVKVVVIVRSFDAVEAKATHAEQQILLLQSQVTTLQAALIARRPYRNPEGTP